MAGEDNYKEIITRQALILLLTIGMNCLLTKRLFKHLYKTSNLIVNIR